MKTHIQNHVSLLIVALVAALTINVTFGDDLTPPSYRGDPLSVYAHWELIPGTNILNLTSWSSVDDSDPSTNLYSAFTPDIDVQPDINNVYGFRIPNFVDNEPIKYLRLQLTWQNTAQPPVSVFSDAIDGTNLIPGVITFASVPIPVDPAAGIFYQYYDIVYQPNPDFEQIQVSLPPDGLLSQVVVDTVSTVPEPATLMLLGLGALTMIRRKGQPARA